MFFHGPHHRPGDHDRGRRRIFPVFLFRSFARLTNQRPLGIDLQICRNNATEFARDGGRKRRLDTGVAAGVSPAMFWLRSRHGCLYTFCTAAVTDRGYSFSFRFRVARENCAELLADIDGVTYFCFPFAHHSGE